MKSRFITIFLLIFTGITAFAQQKVNIWDGVNGKRTVEMTPYIASGDGNKAVIVCPGGSYFWHDMEAEGHSVGRWLQQNGISAFVLNYRAAGVFAFVTHYCYIFRGRRYPDALDDLHQSITYVKNHAAEYHINPDSIGAMGFSAGGHLVMSAAELLPKSERPAFVVPVYPVVTLIEPCVHKRSRRALLGDSRKNNRILRDSLSLERHVPTDCPPVFLVNCQDDPIVKYHNSELLDSALTAQGVPHVYIQYKTGGHGFGATENKGTAECRQWKNAFLHWVTHLPQNYKNTQINKTTKP